MQYRKLGRTGWKVSEISFGAWAIGASWGPVDDQESLAALHRAIDLGVNFIDTADVYGDGRSEQLIARVRKERSEELIVATKAGRRLSPHTADGYNAQNLTRFVERSLGYLETDCLDLVQLHCVPPDVLKAGDILVAPLTTPAWTPLFAMAGGVVTDIGGPLSHGSIVSREYGIPAVMGTGVATQRIESGQLIRVDGDRGTVTLVDEVDASTEMQLSTQSQTTSRMRKKALLALVVGVVGAAALFLLFVEMNSVLVDS